MSEMPFKYKLDMHHDPQKIFCHHYSICLAVTLSIMTVSIATLSITTLSITILGTMKQHYRTQQNVKAGILSGAMM